MIHAVRYLLIVGAIIASPFYGLWVLCGWIADKRAQRRHA